MALAALLVACAALLGILWLTLQGGPGGLRTVRLELDEAWEAIEALSGRLSRREGQAGQQARRARAQTDDDIAEQLAAAARVAGQRPPPPPHLVLDPNAPDGALIKLTPAQLERQRAKMGK